MLYLSECSEQLKKFPEHSFDSLVCDPPSGSLHFMGKNWDSDKGGKHQWIFWMTEVMLEVFRVMKPGAHGLVWAIPRSSHWTAMALENAGFEVRDVITHLFGSGFPKSHDISKAMDKSRGVTRNITSTRIKAGDIKGMNNFGSGRNKAGVKTEIIYSSAATDLAKQWEGWGTALKPASEHWILIRKPCSEKTIAKNVEKHGCGGLNIDASRIGLKKGDQKGDGGPNASYAGSDFFGEMQSAGNNRDGLGRFPSNLVLDEEAAKLLDEQSGILRQCSTIGEFNNKESNKFSFTVGEQPVSKGIKGFKANTYAGASRFFYCAKASKKDRNEGLEAGEVSKHPTVKSTKLMEYLITLITPPDGKVLDPFMGSGSTGVAAKRLGFDFTGIEMNEEYFKIAEKRIG